MIDSFHFISNLIDFRKEREKWEKRNSIIANDPKLNYNNSVDYRNIVHCSHYVSLI